MFSELALGWCGPSGVLKIDQNIPLYENCRIRSPVSRRKIESAASCPPFSKQRSTPATSSSAQSETKLNELILPKTYITKKGDLLLFAVIDNELFALVDSASKATKETNEKNHDFAIKPQLLSQYGSLEKFVLAVLEYKHKKEKYLYASTAKKISQFIIKSKLKGIAERHAALNNPTNNGAPGADVKSHFAYEGEILKTSSSCVNNKEPVDRFGNSSHTAAEDGDEREKPNDAPEVGYEHEYERLALPGNSKPMRRGKLRSPLLERKANAQKFIEDEGDREYFNFAIKMGRQSPEFLYTAAISNADPSSLDCASMDQKREFLFSVNRMLNDSNVQNASAEASHLREDWGKQSNSLKQLDDSGLPPTMLTNRKSPADGSNTVLPFVFDSKRVISRGRSAVVGTRSSSATQKLDIKKSFSYQDLRNVNPRISSAKHIPEKRALGMTPSAITLSSEELSRMLEYNSGHRFTLKLSNNSNQLSSASGHMMKFLANHSSSLPAFEPLEELQADVDLLWEKNDHLSIDGNDPIVKRGSLHSVATANKRMDQDSDGHAVLNRPGSCNESISSFLLGSTEEDEDKILFSYISPGLRKGSWNPNISFSFEGLTRENSKDGRSSKGSTLTKASVTRRVKSLPEEELLIKDEADLRPQRTLFSHPNEISTSVCIGSNSFVDPENSVSFEGSHNIGLSPDTQQAHMQTSSEIYSKDDHECHFPNFFTDKDSPWAQVGKPNEGPYWREATNMSVELEAGHLGDGDYERSLLQELQDKGDASEKRDLKQESERKHMSFDAKNSSRDRNEMDFPTEGTSDVQRELAATDTVSLLSSNTATNVSIRHSVADEEILAQNATLPDEHQSNYSEHTVNSSGTPNGQLTEWAGSISINDKNLFESSGSARTVHNSNSGDENQLSNSLTEMKEGVQKNAVKSGLNIQQNLKMHADTISKDVKKSQHTVFLDEGIFTAKQLLDTETKAYSTKTVNNSNIITTDNVVSQGFTSGYNAAASDNKPVGSIVSEVLGADGEMNSFSNASREKRKDKSSQQIDLNSVERSERQTVELKINLKAREESSSDNLSSEAIKSLPSVQSSEKDALMKHKDSLQLDGVGGNDSNDQATLEELKTLLQSNTPKESSKIKKKQSDRITGKKGISKQRKKKGNPSRQSSMAKKGPDSKILSPMLDMPNKMETVETMIGRPKESDNLIKTNPDNEPHAVIENVAADGQLEMRESAQNIAVVRNLEVKRVSEIDPEQQGAYPPSKTKRGAKRGGKKVGSGSKEQAQEKVKYEEQMRLLKEKEIEQQRAREAALAKQKLLEQEKEKYKEDEEEAKKKEEEARKKLAEAKLKAKEEREAKRLADAEKRRQLVEQKREERRQRDLELAEKEKQAERLKFERERRAQELREQRERLKEQERLEEDQMLQNEKLEELKREEEEKRLEEERIKRAQEELERLVEEREYREQLRRVAEAQEVKMREAEEQRRILEEREQQKIAEERERIKRIEYLKLQAELERQKEAENLAAEKRQIMLLKAAKRKTELIKRREENLERMSDLKFKRHSQGISRSFTFTYFVHIPRSVWEMPIGWNSKKSKGGRVGKTRPISVATTMQGS